MTGAVDFVGVHARLQPSRLAALELSSGESLSYADLDARIDRVAAYLCDRGCAKGDRVAVIARNSVWLIVLHFACARAGLIYVPLNWRLSVQELLPLLALAEPRLLFGDASPEAHSLAQTLPVEPLGDVIAGSRQVAPLRLYRADPDLASLILFTSGTSGKSKGVMLTERNLQQAALNFATLSRVGNTSVSLCDAPMFHVIGLVANIRPVLLQGGAMVISDGFNAGRTLKRLGDPQLRISHYVGVPQMIESLRREAAFDPAALRGLTALVSGGAHHRVGDIEAWLDDGIPLVLGFGMTEAGTVFGMSVERDIIRAHLGSAGIAMPGMQVRIVDERGQDCASGQPGELLLRGDAITPGYWRAPDETRRAIDAQGWFATGDIVRSDADGFFWIVDRKKDMFISGGENVYPAEIEMLLVGYPGIAECAVVGLPDERWGEAATLVVVRAEASPFSDGAVLQYLEQRLARYKLPRRVVTLPAMPRTATGKLQKDRLRALLLQQAPAEDAERKR